MLLTAMSAVAFDGMEASRLNFREMKRTFTQNDSVPAAKKHRFKSISENTTGVDVFVTVTESVSLADLENAGLREAERLTPTMVVGTVPVNAIEVLSNAEGVVTVALAGTGHLRNDLSRSLSKVDDIHNGAAGLPQGYTGKGVLVSLYDSGVQPGHINFMDEQKLIADRKAETRVKAIYNYSEAGTDLFGNVKIKESAYLTPEEIATFTTDDANETHGTHTLGIITGSFTSKDFSPAAACDFRGMAPEADIFVSCGPIYYSAIAKAISRITSYADANNQPCVINLSIGDNLGPHDGTDGFAAFLNECGKTTPIIMSAGNEGNINLALCKRFTEDDKDIKTVINPRNTIRTYLGVAYEACTEMQVWSEDNTPFTLEMGLINKKTGEVIYSLPYKDDGSVTYIANGDFLSVSTVEPNEQFDYYYTNSAIGVATGIAENNNRYTASIYYLLKKDLEHIDRYVVPFLIIHGTPGKRVDVYSDGYYNDFSNGKIAGWDAGSANGSISNIACGENVISVGAYRSRQMTDTDPIKVGEVCDYSSYGELPDGRNLPVILAPGGWISSSMSTPFTESEGFSTDTYPAVDGMMFGESPFYWTIMQGTSQAAPAVSGIVALWLQANPDLTPAEIKQIMRETAVECETVTPQNSMGKIDALAGIKRAIELSGIESVADDSAETILIAPLGNNQWRIAAANESVIEISVFNIQGQNVLSTKAYGADTVIDLSALAHGVYIINVRGTDSIVTKKVVI